MSKTVYLDHNATTPVLPVVADAMREAEQHGFANPASQHGPGRDARRIVERARERLLSLLGGEPNGMAADRLVFTSGGSEANDLALRGLLSSRPKRLVISAIEHPSISATADRLEQEGVQVDRLPVDSRGVANLEELRRLLTTGDPVGLVSLMLANNETGVLQPVAEAARLCRESGVPLHTDAVQAVGKITVDFRSLGVAALTFTAHKFHGPLGVGGLLLRHDAQIEPRFFGGHQQAGLRPGTESAPLAAGAEAALTAWHKESGERQERTARLRDHLERGILQIDPQAQLIGGGAERLPHTSCVAFPGADRQALVMAYDLAGVACATGSACASGSSEPSPTLLAMGLPSEVVGGAIRLSLGATTTPDEIDLAIHRMKAVHGSVATVGQAAVD